MGGAGAAQERFFRPGYCWSITLTGCLALGTATSTLCRVQYEYSMPHLCLLVVVPSEPTAHSTDPPFLFLDVYPTPPAV